MSKGSDTDFVTLSFDRIRRSREQAAVEYLKAEAATEVTRDEDEDLADALIRAYAELHEHGFECEATLAGNDVVRDFSSSSPYVYEPTGFVGSKIIKTQALSGTDTVVVVGEDALSDNPVSAHIQDVERDGDEQGERFAVSEYLPFVVTRPESVVVVNV